MSEANDPLDHYGTAKGYLQAAFVILNSPDRFQVQSDETFFLPVHMLWGFALELYLKAFLVFHGFTERQLRGIGHNLGGLAEAARERGLSSSQVDSLVDMLGPDHQNLGYRYPKPGGQFRVPVPNSVFSQFRWLDWAVDGAVGASAAYGRAAGGPPATWMLSPDRDLFRVRPAPNRVAPGP